jgi:molecular chaperone GrpE (heat shock protein)
MSCYLRHMKDILEEAGIEVTGDNKKEIDRTIHTLVEVEYKNCAPAWKAVKGHINKDEETRKRFIKMLKARLK